MIANSEKLFSKRFPNISGFCSQVRKFPNGSMAHLFLPRIQGLKCKRRGYFLRSIRQGSIGIIMFIGRRYFAAFPLVVFSADFNCSTLAASSSIYLRIMERMYCAFMVWIGGVPRQDCQRIFKNLKILVAVES